MFIRRKMHGCPWISIHRNHTTVNCGLKPGLSLSVSTLSGSLWTSCAKYQSCGWVRVEISSLLRWGDLLMSKAHVWNKKQFSSVHPPPLWGEIVLKKSIWRAGQSLKLILLSLLEKKHFVGLKIDFATEIKKGTKANIPQHVGPLCIHTYTWSISIPRIHKMGQLSLSTIAMWENLFLLVFFISVNQDLKSLYRSITKDFMIQNITSPTS